MLKKLIMPAVILGLVAFFMLPEKGQSFVQREGGKTYILDQRGERWDVTQAEARGFNPASFQHGIGRDAFQTLDDSHVNDGKPGASRRLRVIGISKGKDAQAYSVSRLRFHEVANTHLGSSPVSVAY